MSGKYQNKTSVATLISGKIYFMVEQNHYWYKEDHYAMLKGAINLEVIILVCIYCISSAYIKQILPKPWREIDESTITGKDLSTVFSVINRSWSQKFHKIYLDNVITRELVATQ